MGTSSLRTLLLGLAAACTLAACDPVVSPQIKLEPPATNRAGAQTTDFATFVTTMINTKTNDTNAPESVDGILFGNTQNQSAFAELFAE